MDSCLFGEMVDCMDDASGVPYNKFVYNGRTRVKTLTLLTGETMCGKTVKQIITMDTDWDWQWDALR